MTRGLGIFALLLGVAAVAPAAEDARSGSLRGVVEDATGAGVPKAAGEVTGPSGRRTFVTDENGTFVLTRLRPGAHRVVIRKEGFVPWEKRDVGISPDAETPLEAVLAVAPVRETVTVRERPGALSLSPAENAGAIVLREADLEALPDDPDELAEALQALAGPAAGPNGGQIFVDGFTGGRIPPKSAIREIRLNANPLSAEYDRPGFGRIEIFTRPGSDKLAGDVSFGFNNQALNTRDPFAPNEPDYRRTTFGGHVSGPIRPGKASYFLDFDRRAVEDAQVVSGTVLDASLQPVAYQESVVTPQWRTTLSPRLDAQIGSSHTLTLRYSYTSADQDKTGIGGFSLPSQAADRSRSEHELQVGETATLGKVVNELRFRWSRHASAVDPLSGDPALRVLDAFTSGGSQAGPASSLETGIELQNVTSFSLGTHSFRAGFRLRTTREEEDSRQNFGGTVTFAGTQGPALDENGDPILGPDGSPERVPLTSIERYRRTILLQQQGLAPGLVRLLGGGASQLQISGGDPLAAVSQWDLAPFVQDDWKPRDDLVVGLGLRYEVQNNVESPLDFAPRLSVAWSPGTRGEGSPRTVVRGGFGVFYDRISSGLTLDARRYDGESRERFLVIDPVVLDQMTFLEDGTILGIPSTEELAAFSVPQITRLVDPAIRPPRNAQASLGFERSLPGNLNLSVNYILTRTTRALRSRVVSAGARDGSTPTVYHYESTGRSHQDQWIVGLNSRLNPRFSLFARYFLNWARSDTDGASSFPADSDDPGADWGPAGIDVRHRVVLGGRVQGPWGVSLSPFLIYSSARPFNITTGADNDRDTIFADRPALATDPSDPDVIATAFGLFDPTLPPVLPIATRNLGRGPGFFVVNLRLNKTIPFRRSATPTDAGPPPDGPRGGPGGRFGRGGERRGGGRRGGGGPGLNLSASIQNLFDRVNPGAPIGNLTSPSFGQSLSSAGGFGRGGSGSGNRRIELRARVSF